MTIRNIAQNQMSPAMTRLASGQRVNSAADDAAGAAIIEEMTAQVRGLDQGTRNAADMQAMITTAEGGLDTVSDSLNRIRELSVQGLNGTLTDGQRAMIQEEIGQLAQGIQDAVGGTEFNTQTLLDGSVSGANTAASPSGTGPIVSINDMSGIAQAMTAIAEDGSFDLSAIDNAIDQVSAERAALGAMSNVMDYTMSANSVSSLNLADSRSRIADADMAEEMMEVEQERVINELQVMLQQQEQDLVEDSAQRLMATGA
ncbi:MAG: flagellin [Defluviitaleaceae bacterium]|nr:flagellin [Defluviitaleaceae bacterium]MCL2263463.1 flagellin [Defluviitaleaceae bacterium]